MNISTFSNWDQSPSHWQIRGKNGRCFDAPRWLSALCHCTSYHTHLFVFIAHTFFTKRHSTSFSHAALEWVRAGRCERHSRLISGIDLHTESRAHLLLSAFTELCRINSWLFMIERTGADEAWFRATHQSTDTWSIWVYLLLWVSCKCQVFRCISLTLSAVSLSVSQIITRHGNALKHSEESTQVHFLSLLLGYWGLCVTLRDFVVPTDKIMLVLGFFFKDHCVPPVMETVKLKVFQGRNDSCISYVSFIRYLIR